MRAVVLLVLVIGSEAFAAALPLWLRHPFAHRKIAKECQQWVAEQSVMGHGVTGVFIESPEDLEPFVGQWVHFRQNEKIRNGLKRAQPLLSTSRKAGAGGTPMVTTPPNVSPGERVLMGQP
ncbi:hypothetical protein K2X33_07570, partial [bacterium]|nr:hypothetical protein [bacterium]